MGQEQTTAIAHAAGDFRFVADHARTRVSTFVFFLFLQIHLLSLCQWLTAFVSSNLSGLHSCTTHFTRPVEAFADLSSE